MLSIEAKKPFLVEEYIDVSVQLLTQLIGQSGIQADIALQYVEDFR